MIKINHACLALSTLAGQHVPVSPPGATAANPAKQGEMGKAPGVFDAKGLIKTVPPSRRCAGPGEAAKWDTQGLNVGLATGDLDSTTGLLLIAVDIDFDDAAGANIVEAALSAKFPGLVWRTVDCPTHYRKLTLLRISPALWDVIARELPFVHAKTGQKAAISLLGPGRQAVAGGTHKGTGAAIVWSAMPDLHSIPVVANPADLIDHPVQELEAFGWQLSGKAAKTRARQRAMSHAVATTQIVGDEAEVRFLVGLVPNDPAHWSAIGRPDPFATYNQWDDFRRALTVASGGAPYARDLFLDWCEGRAQGIDVADKWDAEAGTPAALTNTGLPWLSGIVTDALGAPAAAAAFFARVPDTAAAVAEFAQDTKAAQDWRWQRIAAEWACIGGARFLRRKMPRAATRSYQVMNTAMHGDMETLNQQLAVLLEKPSDFTEGWSFTTAWHHAAKHLPQLGLIDADDTAYWPGRAPVFRHGDEVLFNTWRPYPPPKAAPHKSLTRPFLRAVRHVFGHEHARQFIKWLAFIVQHPNKKPSWHWLIASKPGFGKSQLMDFTMNALGREHCRTVSHATVSEKYEDYQTARFVAVEEASTHGRGGSAFERMKHALANQPALLTPRLFGTTAVRERPNITCFVFLTNEDIPFYVGADDRRLVAVWRMLAKDWTPAQHAAFADYMASPDAAEGVRDMLMLWPLADADIALMQGKAPASSGKTQLIAATKFADDPVADYFAQLQQIAMDGPNEQHVGLRMVMPMTDIQHHMRRLGARDMSPRLLRAAMQKCGAVPVKARIVNGVPIFDADAVKVDGSAARLWLMATHDSAGNHWAGLPVATLGKLSKGGKFPVQGGPSNVTDLPVKSKKTLAPKKPKKDAADDMV